MRKLTIPIILLCLFSIAGLIYGISLSTSKINNLQHEVTVLQARNDAMVFQYANDQREIDKLKFTITGQNQEIENLQIRNASNDLFINALESKVIFAEMEYQQAISFIETAEWAMSNFGVQYVYVGRR